MKKIFSNLWVLLAAGIIAHLWLIFIGLNGIGTPMGDVPYAYQPWLQQMINSGKLLGINLDWVYPYPALIPIWLAALINPMEFQTGWFTMITILDLVGLAVLADWGRGKNPVRFSAAWYWLTFLVVLGPISISRIDSYSVVLAIFGIAMLVSRRLVGSTVFFSLSAATKIWPIALLLPAIAASKHRRRLLIVTLGALVNLAAIGLILGGNGSLFSFLGYQSSRGIQVESPIASFWIWSGKFGISNSGIYYDNKMMTFQVAGDNIELFAALIGIAMWVAIAITLWLTWRAAKTGARFQAILPVAALTAVLDLIVFNKVGSPQFASWLVVPILLGILYVAPNWKLPIYSVAALALVTGLIYPVIYDSILNAEPWALGVLLLRNLGYVALLIWSNRQLIRLGTNSPAIL